MTPETAGGAEWRAEVCKSGKRGTSEGDCEGTEK